MATVNKNFRIKNGLVVEGSTATVNGQNILVEGGSDSYIIDLIGGQATSANTPNAVVKRDGSGNFSAGTITANLSGNVTGNVTGTVSDISNHDTDALTEGSSNLYFTNQRALDATALAYDAAGSAAAAQSAAESYADGLAVNYDAAGSAAAAQSAAESYADGLAVNYDVAGAAAAAQSAAEAYADQAELDAIAAAESYADSLAVNYDVAGAAAAAQSAAEAYADQAELDAIAAAALDATSKANAAESAANTYTDNSINGLDTDDIEEGTSNLYFTNGRARNAVSGGTGITYSSADGIISVTSGTYDAYGAASTAEGNANTYTDSAINALDTDDIEEGSTNLYYTDTRARGAVSAGSGLSYDSNTGEFTVDTDTIANKTYVDTAVSNLVDSAPALLDTLNELAAAIGDDENFATTVTSGLAEKVAKAGDTMTGALVLHADPVNALEAATKQYVDAAESAAQSAAEATAQGALDDVLDGTTSFTALDVSSVSRQIAATTGNITTAAVTTALSWAKADYRSAKILVKAKNGTHTHVSEVIVTLDTSDNVAVNEYAITTTNGSLMDVTADISGNDVRLRVTPANNNTEVMAHATLLV